MIIEVIAIDEPVKKFKTLVRKKAKALSHLLGRRGAIDIYIVSGQRMKHLNQEFRNKNTSTNVLSFPKPDNFPGLKLGEVFLDPVYIQKHKEDLVLMLVHGVLHILGYDHLRKGDRIKMEKMENRLLKKMV